MAILSRRYDTQPKQVSESSVVIILRFRDFRVFTLYDTVSKRNPEITVPTPKLRMSTIVVQWLHLRASSLIKEPLPSYDDDPVTTTSNPFSKYSSGSKPSTNHPPTPYYMTSDIPSSVPVQPSQYNSIQSAQVTATDPCHCLICSCIPIQALGDYLPGIDSASPYPAMNYVNDFPPTIYIDNMGYDDQPHLASVSVHLRYSCPFVDGGFTEGHCPTTREPRPTSI